jgi:hypothetical protein
MFKQKYYFYSLERINCDEKLFWQKSEPERKERPKAFEERIPPAMINERDERAVAATRDIFSSSSLKRRSFAKMNNFR